MRMFKTYSHIASVLTEAACMIENGSTLKSARTEYVIYQLMTRFDEGSLDRRELDRLICAEVTAQVGMLRTKAGTVVYLKETAAHYDAMAKAEIAAQRAEKAASGKLPVKLTNVKLAYTSMPGMGGLESHVYPAGQEPEGVKFKIGFTLSEKEAREAPCAVLLPSTAPKWVCMGGKQFTGAELSTLFRDWTNNFLSVERFAEHHGFTVEQAHAVIEAGCVAHNEHAEKAK